MNKGRRQQRRTARAVQLSVRVRPPPVQKGGGGGGGGGLEKRSKT